MGPGPRRPAPRMAHNRASLDPPAGELVCASLAQAPPARGRSVSAESDSERGGKAAGFERFDAAPCPAGSVSFCCFAALMTCLVRFRLGSRGCKNPKIPGASRRGLQFLCGNTPHFSRRSAPGFLRNFAKRIAGGRGARSLLSVIPRGRVPGNQQIGNSF